LSVRICPLQQNWKELPEIFEFLNNQNIELFFNSVIFPPYSALWNLSSQKLSEILNYLSSFQFENKTQIQKGNNKSYNNLIEQIAKWQNDAIKIEEKYPDLNNYDTKILLDILIMQVNEYLKINNSFKEVKKQEFALFFENSIKSCEHEINNIEIYNNALRYFIGLPVNRLIDEFNIRNIEKIINFTKQAGKLTLNNI